MNNTAHGIQSLRNVAFNAGEIAFTHLCDTALWEVEGEDGETEDHWAVVRLEGALERLEVTVEDCGPFSAKEFEAEQLRVIRSTDCTRPDGAIARCGIEV